VSPNEFQQFQQQLQRHLHHFIRSSIDRGISVHREEVIAATMRFCLDHLQIIIEDKQMTHPR
jgi:hypothetical protein